MDGVFVGVFKKDLFAHRLALVLYGILVSARFSFNKYNPNFPFCQRGSTKNGHTARKLTEQMIYTRGQLCYSYVNENVSKALTRQDIQVGSTYANEF